MHFSRLLSTHPRELAILRLEGVFSGELVNGADRRESIGLFKWWGHNSWRSCCGDTNFTLLLLLLTGGTALTGV